MWLGCCTCQGELRGSKDGMSDERAPSADYYRQVAEQIRAFAYAARLPEVRRDLLDLARRFDRMALYVEERYPERQSILPSADKAT